jgi:hypothetical protein
MTENTQKRAPTPTICSGPAQKVPTVHTPGNSKHLVCHPYKQQKHFIAAFASGGEDVLFVEAQRTYTCSGEA